MPIKLRYCVYIYNTQTDETLEKHAPFRVAFASDHLSFFYRMKAFTRFLWSTALLQKNKPLWD